MNLKGNENTKERRRTLTLHYIIQKERNLATALRPRFWPNITVFIGRRGIWMARQGHASKIYVWAHQNTTFDR